MRINQNMGIFIICKEDIIPSMTEKKDFLKGYILYENLNSDILRESLLALMRFKAEQIRRYADFVARELYRSGLLVSIKSDITWTNQDLQVVIHIDIVAVKSDKIRDLEKRVLKLYRLQELNNIIFKEPETNNNGDKHE